MNWEYFLNKAREAFYTQFLMNLLSLVVIILYFSVKPKTKSLIYLVIIAIASFLEGLFADYLSLTRKPVIIAIIPIVDATYLFIELIYCLLFIKAHIQSYQTKKIISITPFVFIGYAIILAIILFSTPHSATILHTNAMKFLSYMFIVEGFIIIVSCLYFFYEIFIRDPIKEKLSIPAIWTISGMLILYGTITPFFLFLNYLVKNNRSMEHSLWPIDYISYSLLFITFSMAILSDRKHLRPV